MLMSINSMNDTYELVISFRVYIVSHIFFRLEILIILILNFKDTLCFVQNCLQSKQIEIFFFSTNQSKY